MTATVSETYEVGAILEYQWGYEQTNIDYYKIVRRSDARPSGKCSGVWLWLVKIGKKNVQETGFMSGKCEPDPEQVVSEKPIRRKLAVRDGREIGLSIRSYGWCRLWDGKPSNWSSYG